MALPYNGLTGWGITVLRISWKYASALKPAITSWEEIAFSALFQIPALFVTFVYLYKWIC